MLLQFSAAIDKATVMVDIAQHLAAQGFTIEVMDDARPWGGFFVLSQRQATAFIKTYFGNLEGVALAGKLSPKILVVQPGQRLSWQYHHRRAELWCLTGGAASIVTSQTDEPGTPRSLAVGELVTLQQGERHRLLGATDYWGVVAEIWQHCDAQNPSDENDIVRLQDDFGR